MRFEEMLSWEQDGSLRLVLNASTATQTMPSRFLSEFFGAGVQHIAFGCDDIFKAVSAIRAAGATLLKIPDNYYDDIDSRYELDPGLLGLLKENGILYDRDDEGEFFQAYTHAFEERLFFEIVERRGYRGFGAPNAGVRLAAQTREARPRTMPRIG